MSHREVRDFISHLAVNRNVAVATRNQALSAILFPYKVVIKQTLVWIDPITYAKRPSKLPLLFSRTEVKAILSQLDAHLAYDKPALWPRPQIDGGCVRLLVQQLARTQTYYRRGV